MVMKAKITHYELINGCKSDKIECDRDVETVDDVRIFKEQIMKRENLDPEIYTVGFTFVWPAVEADKYNFLLTY